MVLQSPVLPSPDPASQNSKPHISQAVKSTSQAPHALSKTLIASPAAVNTKCKPQIANPRQQTLKPKTPHPEHQALNPKQQALNRDILHDEPSSLQPLARLLTGADALAKV